MDKEKANNLNKKEELHIACNIDSKYTQYCGVLMVSISENNQAYNIHYHILGDSLTQKNVDSLKNIANYYNNDISIYNIEPDLFNGFPVSDQWPKVIYSRIILPNLLPSHVGKVLYLDCDIVCRGSLKELIETDMEGKTICAVQDILANFPGMYNRLQYSPKYGYFNSGVILFDIPKWKAHNFTHQCMSYLKNNHVIHPDQDALNVVLHDQWKNIDIRWNFISNYHTRYISMDERNMDLYKTDKYYPILVHFTGAKPWSNKCDSPYKKDYLEYQNKTEWHGQIPKHTIKQHIIHLLILSLDALHIKKANKQKCFNI